MGLEGNHAPSPISMTGERHRAPGRPPPSQLIPMAHLRIQVTYISKVRISEGELSTRYKINAALTAALIIKGRPSLRIRRTRLSVRTVQLDSVTKDTLLNLGFAPGEGMEQDFFELCANPDPIDSTPTNLTADQDEDEEAIWRRLVMRGSDGPV
ncbi:hypothetical protein O1611_g10311 [Lasiodiplodia mahajangana]|uniref:Uncharacterized protein n=1 Tax=Lasiodiplodia mahajangana TaxID=1108764 RepID=A0ACC2J0F0_9PEZI|nr:hypothetical protein O1611_g10311 [Lasiodiplodia mahajangana]